MRVKYLNSHILKKNNSKTNTYVLLLSFCIFFLIFIGIGIGMYFLYIETGSIHGTVLAGSMSSVIILLIIWGLFAGKLAIETPKYKIETTKKRISTFGTIVGMSIVNIAILTPFVLLGFYEHKAFLLGIIPILFPTVYYIRERLLIQLKGNTYFQKVSDINLASKYLKNTNFLNHHNYFKNRDLENKYLRYKTNKLILYIIRNIFIFIGIIFFGYFFPEIFIQIILYPIVLTIAIIPLLVKDRIKRKSRSKINKISNQIYFRKIHPTTFQKIKNKIFFY